MSHHRLAALSLFCSKMSFRDFEVLVREKVDSVVDILSHPVISDPFKENVSRCPQVFELAENELRTFQQSAAKITTPIDEDYPVTLLESLYPPLLLSYWGEPAWLKYRPFSVVGCREPSNDSYEWLDRHLSMFVAEQEVVTVSGGARGIDQKVHSISLRQELPTVVFLPSGLRQIYPPTLQDWVESIIRFGGAVVSEFPLNQKMRRSHFFQRNRMIASISKSLLVVEARRHGGSMMTAQWALEQGQTVATLPGFPSDQAYGGNHRLLRDGALMILDSEDLKMLI